MMADDFRDYMLSFLFWKYLSDNYIKSAQKELGSDYAPLQIWYDNNPSDTFLFEKQMKRKIHYVIEPKYLWDNIIELARTQSDDLLQTLQEGFKYIENESFESSFKGLFSEINLNSEKLGKNYTERNTLLCKVIKTIADGLAEIPSDSDALGDAYEYLIGQFAAGSGQKAGEFYTPQMISTILSRIVTLDCQDPSTGKKKRIDKVLDFACGSGSLLLNVRREMEGFGIGKLYGQEKNITTYNLARMNMLLHGVKDTEFEIRCGRQSAFQPALGSDRGNRQGFPFQSLWCGTQVSSRFCIPAARFPFFERQWHDGHHSASRRAVSWRQGRSHPQETARRRQHRCRHRSARQLVLFYGYSCMYPRAEEMPQKR